MMACASAMLRLLRLLRLLLPLAMV